jgi:hypothetical protein
MPGRGVGGKPGRFISTGDVGGSIHGSDVDLVVVTGADDAAGAGGAAGGGVTTGADGAAAIGTCTGGGAGGEAGGANGGAGAAATGGAGAAAAGRMTGAAGCDSIGAAGAVGVAGGATGLGIDVIGGGVMRPRLELGESIRSRGASVPGATASSFANSPEISPIATVSTLTRRSSSVARDAATVG